MQETWSKDNLFSKKLSINVRGRLIQFDVPRVMGILNVTPDSFYDGGRYTTKERISARVDAIISQGADMIDIGGYSTRPGASDISKDEELQRLIIAAEIITRNYPDFPISVDTFRAEVADIMIRDFGAGIINDITGGTFDNKMIDTVARAGIPFVVMHIQGTPRTMQVNPSYEDVVNDILLYFAERINFLKERGIMDYIVDPGFGFGKTLDHNYQLLNELEAFNILESPVMIGVSRKSMICKQLNINAEQALNGTTALHMAALIKGANILRVHDVREAAETVILYTKMSRKQYLQ